MAGRADSKPVLRPGAVFRYACLWHREYVAGQTEGRKDRPALALAVAISDQDGRRHILALPITHAQPKAAHHGVELPAPWGTLLLNWRGAVSNLKCNTGVLDFSVIHFLRGFKAQNGAGAVVEGCRDSVEVAL